MSFTVPNAADAIEYPPGSGIYPQAQLDAVDWQILGNAAGGSNGISSGCAVTQHTSPAQSVDVASGTVVVANAEAVVTSGTVSATAANATLPRFDLVVVNASGTKSIVAGTAASTPVFPAIPASSLVLAALFRRPGDNIITTDEIVDKRVTVAAPLVFANEAITVPKTADESVTSSATLQDDNHLKTPSLAAGTFFIEVYLYWDAGSTGDIKFGWSSTDGAATLDWSAAGVGSGSANWGNDGAVTNLSSTKAIGSTGTFPGGNAGTTQHAAIHGRLILAATGDLKFRWAQNASDGTATRVFKGSLLRYTQLA